MKKLFKINSTKDLLLIFKIFLSTGLTVMSILHVCDGKWLSMIAMLLFGGTLLWLLSLMEEKSSFPYPQMPPMIVKQVYGNLKQCRSERIITPQFQQFHRGYREGERDRIEEMSLRQLKESIFKEIEPFIKIEKWSDYDRMLAGKSSRDGLYGPDSILFVAKLDVVQSWDERPNY